MAASSRGRSPQYDGAPASTIVTSPPVSTRYELTRPLPSRRMPGPISMSALQADRLTRGGLADRRKDRIRERRPRLERPWAEVAVGERHQPDVRHRIDPDERPCATDVAERRRAVGQTHPMRRLTVVQLGPETPVTRIE